MLENAIYAALIILVLFVTARVLMRIYFPPDT